MLAAELRRFRVDADTVGAASTIHRLRNSALTVQGALGLIETRLAQGQAEEIDALLDLAEARLREGRALLARTRRVRSPGRRISAQQAA